MTITLDIHPEVQAELARLAAAQGSAIEVVATTLLEQAVHPERAPLAATDEVPTAKHQTGRALIDAFADIRGLLTDDEIDRMFARNPSTARPVDFS